MARSNRPKTKTRRPKSNSRGTETSSRAYGERSGPRPWTRRLIDKLCDHVAAENALAIIVAVGISIAASASYFCAPIYYELFYQKSQRIAEAREQKRSCIAAFDQKNGRVGHMHCGYAAGLYKPLADVGDPDALYELAKLACLGWGIKQNVHLAKELFERAKLNWGQRSMLAENMKDYGPCLPGMNTKV